MRPACAGRQKTSIGDETPIPTGTDPSSTGSVALSHPKRTFADPTFRCVASCRGAAAVGPSSSLPSERDRPSVPPVRSDPSLPFRSGTRSPIDPNAVRVGPPGRSASIRRPMSGCQLDLRGPRLEPCAQRVPFLVLSKRMAKPTDSSTGIDIRIRRRIGPAVRVNWAFPAEEPDLFRMRGQEVV